MKKRVNVERSTAGTKKRSPDGLTIARSNLQSPQGRYSPKQDELHN